MGKQRDKPAGAPRRTVRAFWSGTISFGLVSVPVDLYSAHRSKRIALRMLDQDGTPLRRTYFCPAHQTDVHAEHLLRGYEVGDGEHVVVRDDELEALAPRKSRDIDLSRFVHRGEIPPPYFQRSYFLAPAGESTKAYGLLAEVMEQTGHAGIATFVMRGKEYLVVILSEGGILCAETLRFQDELRTPRDVGLPEPVPADKNAVQACEEIIDSLSRKTIPDDVLRDRDTEDLQALIERKRGKGQDVVAAPDVEEEGDEDLEDDEDAGADGADLLAKIRESLRGKRQPQPPAHSKTAAQQLKDLSKDELYRRAKQQGITGRSKMSKQQLIRSLKNKSA
jgi:DNA end-binding protein Ku